MPSTSPLDPNEKKVALYYDGLCRVCSAEIAHYRGMRGADRIDFVDISATDFDLKAEGLEGRDVNRVLHARDVDGTLHLGVDAFILIWSRLDRLTWLSRLAKHQPLNGLLQLGYQVFIRARPYLPRKPCDPAGTCRI